MYLKVVNDIIRYYRSFLSERELVVLSKIREFIKSTKDEKISDEIIIFINRILDRIWNLTLTDIKEYKLGEDFTFLVKETRYWIYDGNIVDFIKEDFKLITNEIVKDIPLDEIGEIISPNFTNNLRTTPILPIYFEKKDKTVKRFNYDTIGFYSTTEKFKDISAAIDLIKDTSEKKNKEIVYLDKSNYRKQDNLEIFTVGDIEEIISMYVSKYLDDSNKELLNSISFSLRKSVMRKKRRITKLVLDYYNNELTKEELKKLIYSIIEEDEKNLTNKKQK